MLIGEGDCHFFKLSVTFPNECLWGFVHGITYIQAMGEGFSEDTERHILMALVSSEHHLPFVQPVYIQTLLYPSFHLGLPVFVVVSVLPASVDQALASNLPTES